MLSAVGKEIMLKVATVAVQIFVMSCFMLSAKLCKEFSALTANYWWGEVEGKKKIHWRSWGKLTQEKMIGDLDSEAYNTSTRYC